MHAQHRLPGAWIHGYRRNRNQVLGHRWLVAGVDPPMVPAESKEAAGGAGGMGNQVGIAGGKGALELIFPSTLSAEVDALVGMKKVVAVHKGYVHMPRPRGPFLEINRATAIDGVIGVEEREIRLWICGDAVG